MAIDFNPEAYDVYDLLNLTNKKKNKNALDFGTGYEPVNSLMVVEENPYIQNQDFTNFDEYGVPHNPPQDLGPTTVSQLAESREPVVTQSVSFDTSEMPVQEEVNQEQEASSQTTGDPRDVGTQRFYDILDNVVSFGKHTLGYNLEELPDSAPIKDPRVRLRIAKELFEGQRNTLGNFTAGALDAADDFYARKAKTDTEAAKQRFEQFNKDRDYALRQEELAIKREESANKSNFGFNDLGQEVFLTGMDVRLNELYNPNNPRRLQIGDKGLIDATYGSSGELAGQAIDIGNQVTEYLSGQAISEYTLNNKKKVDRLGDRVTKMHQEDHFDRTGVRAYEISSDKTFNSKMGNDTLKAGMAGALEFLSDRVGVLKDQVRHAQLTGNKKAFNKYSNRLIETMDVYEDVYLNYNANFVNNVFKYERVGTGSNPITGQGSSDSILTDAQLQAIQQLSQE